MGQDDEPTVAEIIDEVSPLLRTDQHNYDNVETTPDHIAAEIDISKWSSIVILLSIYIGVFLAALDGTVVAALLGHIASEFNEFKSVSWIATSYLISNAAFQPLFGKLTDIFGRRQGLVACNVLFGIGCCMCGYAPSLGALVAGRLIQGIGGGGLTALSTITISDIIPIRKRGVFQGVGNIVFGLGAGLGGVLGGWISENVGWRFAFVAQIPIVILSTLAIFRYLHLPVTKGSEEANFWFNLKRVDFLGSLTLSGSLILFLLALSIGGSFVSWTSPITIGLLAGSVVVAFIYVYVEQKVAKEPVIPLQLLKIPTISSCALTSWFGTMAVYSYLFYVPIYLTTVRSLSASQAGYRLAANFLGVAMGSFGAGIYMRITGRYKNLLHFGNGSFLLAAGLLTTFSYHTSIWLQVFCMFCLGTGFAIMLTVTLIALIAAVPHEFQAVSTSIQYACRGTGSTMGVAIASALFQNVLYKSLMTYVQGSDKLKIIEQVRDSSDAINLIPEKYRPAVIASYMDASSAVFIFIFVTAVLTTLATIPMKEHHLHANLARK